MASDDGVVHPLRQLAQKFKELREATDPDSEHVPLRLFAEASARVNVFFGLLGVAFHFAGRDYVEKVCVLGEGGVKGVRGEGLEMVLRQISSKPHRRKENLKD